MGPHGLIGGGASLTLSLPTLGVQLNSHTKATRLHDNSSVLSRWCICARSTVLCGKQKHPNCHFEELSNPLIVLFLAHHILPCFFFCFSRGTVPISYVSFCEILSINNLRNSLGISFLGPTFALMPNRVDHHRTSKETAFDIGVEVGSGSGEDVESSRILFTTRKTDRYRRKK